MDILLYSIVQLYRTYVLFICAAYTVQYVAENGLEVIRALQYSMLGGE